MELKGKFKVQLYEGENMVSEHIANNTVVTQGLEQIIRWLSRQQFPDTDSFEFGKTRMSVGEKRLIYLGSKDDGWSLSDSDWDNENGRGFDFDSLSYDYNHLARSHGEDNYRIQFKDPIDIISIGYLIRGRGGYHDNNFENARVWIRLNGFITSGAGDSQYDQNYETRYIKHNNKYSYKSHDSEHYVYANVGGEYVISTSIDGTSQYETINSPNYPWEGVWTTTGGIGSPPTVDKGSGINRPPIFINAVNESNGNFRIFDGTQARNMNWSSYDSEFDSIYKQDSNWIGNAAYQLFDFRAPEELELNQEDRNPQAKTTEYGYLREVEELYMYSYSNMGDGNGYQDFYIYRLDIYSPELHPQNPYALKLGTDDGTILPLASGNMSLGALSSGMEWNADMVAQPSGTYKVRYTKEIPFGEGNGVTFSEIGLFMNKDGHTEEKMTLPSVENANDIFSRAIFDTPWSKNESQHAVIYYELEVQ